MNMYLGGCFLLMILFSSCKEDRKVVTHYIPPIYQPIALTIGDDSLYFPLASNTYNNIRSFNYFVVNNKEYIGFYDKMSISFNIYDFQTQDFLKRISLDSCMPDKKLAKHTTVYCKNPDSLFVINKLQMYILDRSNKIKDSIDFDKHSYVAFTSFDFGAPPVIMNNEMYLPASPFLSQRKKKELKKWKTLYQVDLQKKKSSLLFELPKMYIDSLYGLYFLSPSYCINDKGRFVFSFPADSNIYETDLKDYDVAYTGKSIYQKKDIEAVDEKDLGTEDGPKMAYLLRDSYGNIFFDPYYKRYMRIAEHRITEQEYLLGKRSKDKSIIFFNENLQIIGESIIPPGISLSTLFFTKDGRMYTRDNYKDEYGVHLIQLEYKDSSENKMVLNNSKP